VATNEYREECDTLGSFLSECCDLDPNLEAAGGDLYGVYRLWATDNGLGVLSNVRFSKRLLSREGITREAGECRVYTGLAVNNEWRRRVDAIRDSKR